MVDIHDLASRHLPGDYTVDRREFTDGDERTLAKHSVGWELGTRIDYVLWKELGQIWVEYFEGDTQRDRAVYTYELGERAI